MKDCKKKYDGNDCDENIKKQRFALPYLLQGLADNVGNLPEAEKAKIPETVWNRLGNVFINENLNDYYERKPQFEAKGAVRESDIKRFNKHLDTYEATIKVLPDVAKYGLKRAEDKDKRLLSDTIINAHARLSELTYSGDLATIQKKMPKDYKHDFDDEQEALHERAQFSVKTEKRNRKKHEGVARRKQEIKQRLVARKKEDKVSGVAIADKIAEAQISGVIYEPVTPEKGKQLSDSIKRKLLSQKQTGRS